MSSFALLSQAIERTRTLLAAEQVQVTKARRNIFFQIRNRYYLKLFRHLRQRFGLKLSRFLQQLLSQHQLTLLFLRQHVCLLQWKYLQHRYLDIDKFKLEWANHYRYFSHSHRDIPAFNR